MLREIWLVQPLAFARGGSSPTPCDAFDWADPDLSPDGSGRTQIVPADTLIVDPETGNVSLKPVAEINDIIFKDGDHIRPVCPFFELHGKWTKDGKIVTGPVTPEALKASGKSAADLEWRIEFRNDKAAHWTQAVGDQVIATVELRGDDHRPKPLQGHAPWGVIKPLVPPFQSVPASGGAGYLEVFDSSILVCATRRHGITASRATRRHQGGATRRHTCPVENHPF